ncbi:SusC/RagA family TonB-linked outer membrane protein [Pseudochryseolinea flava]|nr:SusC/RagA family TonB-linked outer membrane protein [Pseudochryseolinea flava]
MKRSTFKIVALLCLLLTSATVYGQTVTGKVSSSADGSPIPGASVIIKGTTLGTTTDTDGRYTITPADPASAVLVVSFIGFATIEVPVLNKTSLDVTLQEDITALNEVVVTALGIEKDSKTLTYSMQQVNGDKLNVAKDANFINGLTGKVPGLVINRSSSGVGGSVRILLRGQKSTRDNQPLIVIDGVPIASANSTQTTEIWAGRDGGDVLSMINPADIESTSVLKGAAASTLYGSLGQNGVIIITTKKGKAGATKVDFSSNFTIDKPMYYPELQYEYLQTATDATDSWGQKGSSKDHVKKFFDTGTTWINSVSISTGTEKSQTYLSYSNTNNQGILPTSDFKQHTLNYRQTVNINSKFSIDGNVILGLQKNHNRMAGGFYFNPLTGLYMFPRGLNFDQYKQFEYFSPSRLIYAQKWWNIDVDAKPEPKVGQDNQQNPYWILNRNAADLTRRNVFASVGLNYKFNDVFALQVRGNVSDIADKFEQKVYATTQGTLTDKNGRFIWQEGHSMVAYGDAILTAKKSLTDNFGITGTLGTALRYEQFTQQNLDSKGSGDGLVSANVFTLGAVVPSTSLTALKTVGSEVQTAGLFGSVSFDYKKAIFLDLTARNDWSSSLAFTSKMNSGFFYFSGGLNVIISELTQLPEVISFAKIRTSYAEIGNGLPAYMTSSTYTFNAGNQVLPEYYAKYELKPEKQKSLELGTEIRFLDDRLALDLTFYKINNTDQFFNLNASKTTGYQRFGINVGDVQNKGIEAALNVDVLQNGSLQWNTGINFTANRNTVTGIPLADGSFAISAPGVNSYGFYLTEGGSFGDIYGRKFLRKDGKIVVDNSGKPLAAGGPLEYVGNPQPKAVVGWNNTLTYKNFTLNILVDGRFGGQVMSMTEALLDQAGVSKTTADARNAGGVNIPAVVTLDGGATTSGDFEGLLPAQTFYQTAGGRAGISEHYVYSATNVRLRELSLGYSFPTKIGVIRDLKISLIGRNLFFFTNKAPFDPELSMSTGVGVQGVDAFALPSTRSIGLNLKASF